MTTSSGKHLEDNSHARIVSFLLKPIFSAKDTDDLSIRLIRDRSRRQVELTNNKYKSGKYHVRIMPKDVFGFVKHQEKATFGIGYKLTLTGNKEDSVLNKAEAITDARIKINNIPWYLTYYTPFIPQQGILSKQILSKTLKGLRYFERYVFFERR